MMLDFATYALMVVVVVLVIALAGDSLIAFFDRNKK
jgi:hypothetical protein